MRITVTRTGGVAGIRRHAEVDTATRDDAEAWHRLVRAADLDHAPEQRPAADRFVYRVRVDERETTVGEADLTGPLRDLVDSVLAEG